MEATFLDEAGDAIGGFLMFVKDAMLSSLEVCSVADEPLQLPGPTRLLRDRIQGR